MCRIIRPFTQVKKICTLNRTSGPKIGINAFIWEGSGFLSERRAYLRGGIIRGVTQVLKKKWFYLLGAYRRRNMVLKLYNEIAT